MGKNRPLVAVSGGFDPIHKGHVQMILEASKFGDVVVILNSDDWNRWQWVTQGKMPTCRLYCGV